MNMRRLTAAALFVLLPTTFLMVGCEGDDPPHRPNNGAPQPPKIKEKTKASIGLGTPGLSLGIRYSSDSSRPVTATVRPVQMPPGYGPAWIIIPEDDGPAQLVIPMFPDHIPHPTEITDPRKLPPGSPVEIIPATTERPNQSSYESVRDDSGQIWWLQPRPESSDPIGSLEGFRSDELFAFFDADPESEGFRTEEVGAVSSGFYRHDGLMEFYVNSNTLTVGAMLHQANFVGLNPKVGISVVALAGEDVSDSFARIRIVGPREGVIDAVSRLGMYSLQRDDGLSVQIEEGGTDPTVSALRNGQSLYRGPVSRAPW